MSHRSQPKSQLAKGHTHGRRMYIHMRRTASHAHGTSHVARRTWICSYEHGIQLMGIQHVDDTFIFVQLYLSYSVGAIRCRQARVPAGSHALPMPDGFKGRRGRHFCRPRITKLCWSLQGSPPPGQPSGPEHVWKSAHRGPPRGFTILASRHAPCVKKIDLM